MSDETIAKIRRAETGTSVLVPKKYTDIFKEAEYAKVEQKGNSLIYRPVSSTEDL